MKQAAGFFLIVSSIFCTAVFSSAGAFAQSSSVMVVVPPARCARPLPPTTSGVKRAIDCAQLCKIRDAAVRDSKSACERTAIYYGNEACEQLNFCKIADACCNLNGYQGKERDEMYSLMRLRCAQFKREKSKPICHADMTQMNPAWSSKILSGTASGYHSPGVILSFSPQDESSFRANCPQTKYVSECNGSDRATPSVPAAAPLAAPRTHAPSVKERKNPSCVDSLSSKCGSGS